MKFLQILFLNDNKLRNLDENLSFLKTFSFIKNLNLFGNPLSEEPEYRARVIDAIPSLELFDRHSKLKLYFRNINKWIEILNVEKIKSAQIVKEFTDPLSKKHVKRVKRPKVSENFSVTEKELFIEAENILKYRKKSMADMQVQQLLLVIRLNLW